MSKINQTFLKQLKSFCLSNVNVKIEQNSVGEILFGNSFETNNKIHEILEKRVDIIFFVETNEPKTNAYLKRTAAIHKNAFNLSKPICSYFQVSKKRHETIENFEAVAFLLFSL